MACFKLVPLNLLEALDKKKHHTPQTGRGGGVIEQEIEQSSSPSRK
jgi:hypothetical protein